MMFRLFKIGRLCVGINLRRWKTRPDFWRGVNACTMVRGRTWSVSFLQVSWQTAPL